MRDEVFKSSKQQALSFCLLPATVWYCQLCFPNQQRASSQACPPALHLLCQGWAWQATLAFPGCLFTGLRQWLLIRIHSGWAATNGGEGRPGWGSWSKSTALWGQGSVSDSLPYVIYCGHGCHMTIYFSTCLAFAGTWRGISILPLLVHRLGANWGPLIKLGNVLDRQNFRAFIQLPPCWEQLETERKSMCPNHSHKSSWKLNPVGSPTPRCFFSQHKSHDG